MNLARHSHARRTTATTVVALAIVAVGALPASASPAATAPERPVTATPPGAPTSEILYGSALFATWGTVTNGDSSANAAERRRQLAGAHAGSTNAAEAPAFWARSH